MLNQEQKNYIDNLKANYADTTEEVLVETLQGAGWSEEEVAAAVKRFYNVEEVLPPPPRPTASPVVDAPEKTLETPKELTEETKIIEKAEDLAHNSGGEEVGETTGAPALAVATTLASQAPELSDYEKARQKRLEQEAKVTQFLNEDEEVLEQNTDKAVKNKRVVSFLAGLVILIIGLSGGSIWWVLQKSGGGNIATLTNENILEFFVRKGLDGNFIEGSPNFPYTEINLNFGAKTVAVIESETDVKISDVMAQSIGLTPEQVPFVVDMLLDPLFSPEVKKYHQVNDYPITEGSLQASYHAIVSDDKEKSTDQNTFLDKMTINYSVNNKPETFAVEAVKTDNQFFSLIKEAPSYDSTSDYSKFQGQWIQTSLETLPNDGLIISDEMMPLLSLNKFGESGGILYLEDADFLKESSNGILDALNNKTKNLSSEKVQQVKIMQDLAKRQGFIKIIGEPQVYTGDSGERLLAYEIQILGNNFLPWYKELTQALEGFDEPFTELDKKIVTLLEDPEIQKTLDFVANKLKIKLSLDKNGRIGGLSFETNLLALITKSEILGDKTVELSAKVELYNIGRPQPVVLPEKYLTVEEAAKVLGGYTDKSIKIIKQRHNMTVLDYALRVSKFSVEDGCYTDDGGKYCPLGAGDYPDSLLQVVGVNSLSTEDRLIDSFTGREYLYESAGKSFVLKYQLEFDDRLSEDGILAKNLISSRYVGGKIVLDTFGVQGENTMTERSVSEEADASVKDSDGDGVSDRLEKLYGLNPYSDNDDDYKKIRDLYYKEHLDSGW